MTRNASYPRRSLVAAALLTSLLAVRPAAAQSPTAPPTGDDWECTLAAYLMGASLSGNAVVKGRENSVDISSSDIFEHLDFGFMGMAAARKGNWGVYGDAVFVALSVDGAVPPGIPAEFKPTIALYSLSGVRRLSPWADATLGVRWNHVKGELAVPVAAVNVEKTRDWFDPVAGVVLRTPGTGRFHGTLMADVGGFGVGSDLTWQVFPFVGVSLGKKLSFEAGYRWLKTDYKTGEGADRFEYDILYQGPVGGLTFKF